MKLSHVGCFEGGYSWGRSKEITWLFPSDVATEAISRAWESGSRTAVAQAFYSALPELAECTSIAKDSPGANSSDEAFDVFSTQLPSTLDHRPARSVFSAGAGHVP